MLVGGIFFRRSIRVEGFGAETAWPLGKAPAISSGALASWAIVDFVEVAVFLLFAATTMCCEFSPTLLVRIPLQ